MTGELRVVEALSCGPRGRRLLLEYALASERIAGRDEQEESLSSAVFLTSYHLDPHKGSTAIALFGDGAEEAELTVITPEETATRLEQVALAEVTPRLLLLCLSPFLAPSPAHRAPVATGWSRAMPGI